MQQTQYTFQREPINKPSMYQTTFIDNSNYTDYASDEDNNNHNDDDNELSDASFVLRQPENHPTTNDTDDGDTEFRRFITDIKTIDTCNLFARRSDNEHFRFGDYVCRLIKLLDSAKYRDESLKALVNKLNPPECKDKINVNDDDDVRFIGRLINFTKAVIDEPRLESVAIETILLFNLLHSRRAIIKRDDTDSSDAPALIGKFDVDSTSHTIGYGFPSRFRYTVSIDVLDLYETSCKPEALLKRLRHPAYQEKCKLPTTNKYLTSSFLDSLKIAKTSIRKNTDSDTLTQYRVFLSINKHLFAGDVKTNRQIINDHINTIQDYPALRQSVIESTITKICKLSLSIERYVATRTSGSMDNENYQFPCFLHFSCV